MEKEILTTEPVVRNYKDTVFRMIFKDKKELLALYNAINDTNYSNVDDLEITTLENAIYMTVKNDVSFVVDMTLNLYEHQSTINPHIPIRDLDYVSKTFSSFYRNKDLYASTQKIKLPNPRFIVFYNGLVKEPARREIKLSDLYMISEDNPKLELIVTQINVNPGYNDDLMKKCPTLNDYMLFVDLTREYQKIYPLQEAINMAVEECIRKGILADFLIKNKSEVISMSIFEYNEKLHEQTLREEGEEIGRKKGIAEGEAKERATNIARSIASLRALPLTNTQIAQHLINTFDLTIDEANQHIYDSENK